MTQPLTPSELRLETLLNSESEIVAAAQLCLARKTGAPIERLVDCFMREALDANLGTRLDLAHLEDWFNILAMQTRYNVELHETLYAKATLMHALGQQDTPAANRVFTAVAETYATADSLITIAADTLSQTESWMHDKPKAIAFFTDQKTRLETQAQGRFEYELPPMDKKSLQAEHARLNYALGAGYRKLRAFELKEIASDIGYYSQSFESVDENQRTRFLVECLPLNLRNLDGYKDECTYLEQQLALSAQRGWIPRLELN